MEKDYKKQLTLKFKSVQRLIKEYNCYLKEVTKLEAKLLEADEDSKKKCEDNLEDTRKTIDVVKAKLRSFLDELIALSSEISDEDTKELEEYKTAQKVIEEGLLLF